MVLDQLVLREVLVLQGSQVVQVLMEIQDQPAYLVLQVPRGLQDKQDPRGNLVLRADQAH